MSLIKINSRVKINSGVLVFLLDDEKEDVGGREAIVEQIIPKTNRHGVEILGVRLVDGPTERVLTF